MSVPVALRTDFTGLQLRTLAKRSKDAAFARRLLALAEIFDGGARSDPWRIGGVGLQTIRDWVMRFNAKGPEGVVMSGRRPLIKGFFAALRLIVGAVMSSAC